MSLNLTRILPQIARLGETISEQRRNQRESLPKLREGLDQAHQMGSDVLRARVKAAGDRWTGAAPTDEAVNAIFPAPPPLTRCTLIGVDGSQVYPDRHAAALYYLINTGSIAIGNDGNNDVSMTNGLIMDEADPPIPVVCRLSDLYVDADTNDDVLCWFVVLD